MDNKYTGCDLEPRQLELRGMKIDPVYRQGEADLIRSRWFDYSRLHPTQCTYLYAHLYKEFTRQFYEAYIDIRTADKARAFFPDDVFMSSEMTGMWLARRAADALGAPYGFVLQFASDRALERTYRSFPRPNQLYSEEFEIDLKQAWDESLTRAIRYSRLPRFQAAEYVANPIQRAHATFVIEQIKKRPAPQANLLGRMFHEKVLSRVMVTGQLEDSLITSAEAISERMGLQS